MGQEQSWPWFWDSGEADEGENCGIGPQTGKLISVAAQFIHTGEWVEIYEFRGQRVTSDWTVNHLARPVGVKLRVRAQCLRFTCFGHEAKGSDTICEMMRCTSLDKLPGRVNLFLHLVDRDEFPHRLSGFQLARVPLAEADFERPKISSHSDGWCWTLHPDTEEKYGLCTPDGIRAQVSPMHPLTLDDSARARVGIPEEAEHFCFSYPSPAWEVVEASTNPYELSTWQEGSLEDHHDVLDFLRIGAFMYVDKQDRIVGLATLRPQHIEGSGLCFAEPQPWLPEWTAALVARSRFQPVTMKILREKGARYFVWLRPGELIEGPHGEPLKQQPEIPHGGFVYLFRSDLYIEDEEHVCMDRYFAVATATLTRSKSQGSLRERPHFEVVREKIDEDSDTGAEKTDASDVEEQPDQSHCAPWSVLLGAGA